MPAGAWTVYGLAKEALLEGRIDLDTDNFSIFLATSGYTPSNNADDTYSDVSGSEVAAGSGYTTGGNALVSPTVTHSAGTVTFDAADPTWASATFTAKYAVIARRAGVSLVAGDLLLCYSNLDTGGGSVTGGGGAFTIQLNASGIFTLT